MKTFFLIVYSLIIFARSVSPTTFTNETPIDSPTLIYPPVTVAETGEEISSEPAGYWLPPSDFLTEEEKEFREEIIETAGLDKKFLSLWGNWHGFIAPTNSQNIQAQGFPWANYDPELKEKLARIYSAKTSSDFPNYETYRLAMDYRRAMN